MRILFATSGTRGDVHAGGDRDLMAEVARQPHVAVARIVLGLGGENDRAGIDAAVVDEDRLGRAVEAVHEGVETPQQERQHGFLVVDRNDDGVAHVFRRRDHGKARRPPLRCKRALSNHEAR